MGAPNRASGFCYFNDPVFAVLTFLAKGLERVLYVDLDAHHGDGVQDAFADDPRVLTVSIHEEKRWPHSGLVEDRAAGGARNLPVPRGFNDSELDFLMDNAVLPLAREFEPQALVITCGVDGLDGDPLSRLSLSNVGLWRAVEKLVAEQPARRGAGRWRLQSLDGHPLLERACGAGWAGGRFPRHVADGGAGTAARPATAT